jgi:S-methylmethionine-dependent homocysteine/selenocysteine methylase
MNITPVDTTTTTALTSNALPQLGGGLFLADAGLETSLVHDDGLDLPDFTTFGLLDTDNGRKVLTNYYERFVDIASTNGRGIVLETATWRVSADWLEAQAYPATEVARLNRAAVDVLLDLRARTRGTTVVVSGCIGPRYDGYVAEPAPDWETARDYHAAQASALVAAGVDLVTATTMTTPQEALGIVLAAQSLGVPAVVSFTVETDGRLPDGTSLAAAIAYVDEATAAYPAYYMVNCAHPQHFREVIGVGAPGAERIRGVRANASTCSHAELDGATTLDRGDPQDLAQHYLALLAANPGLVVLGGCCGTNHEHIAAIAAAMTEVTA